MRVLFHEKKKVKNIPRDETRVKNITVLSLFTRQEMGDF